MQTKTNNSNNSNNSKYNPPQLSSSDQSPHSFTPSHVNSAEMQILASLQWNWLARHAAQSQD